MTAQLAAFYVNAGILILAALRVITARNPVHAALWLVLAFFSAAGLWMLLYAEFLAAIEVDRDYRKHFGPLDFDEPFAHDEVRLRAGMYARDLVRAGLSRDELETYNPAITSAALSAFSGRR